MPRKTLYEQRMNAANKAGWDAYEKQGSLLDALRFSDAPLLRNRPDLTARSVFVGAFWTAWEHYAFNNEMPTDYALGYFAGFFSPEEYTDPMAHRVDQSSFWFGWGRMFGKIDRKCQEESHV